MGPQRYWLPPALRRRRIAAARVLLTLFVLAGLGAGLFLAMLPHDATFRLWLNMRNREAFWTPKPHELKWLSRPAAYPINWKDDVGIVVKSGFGTQHRIPAWLEAVREVGDVVLIADYATKAGEHYSKHGRELPVHDVVGAMFEQGVFSVADLEHPRAQQYKNMSEAITRGDESAMQMAKDIGWGLDAMKFVSGLELAYKQMPNKKWYLLVDDDTYIVQDSMTLLLERLNSRKRYYIGNPVGGWALMFGHGGSSIVMSNAAVHRLYSPAFNHLITQTNHESLDETWGDRLLAKAFIGVGIYLDQAYSVLFNGERPRISWIRADRFCAPVVSFHGHSNPEDMRETGNTFRNLRKVIRWIDIWDITGAPDLATFRTSPQRRNWDHIGRLDERVTTSTDLKSADECHAACKAMRGPNWPKGKCLAWTWDDKEGKCFQSPWMIVGSQAEGRISGLNEERVSELAAACNPIP
ncbi:hypothetical protein GE09DRAFT_158992 [Coniochaeta sp. 2T2.1]|nr:hypothetical protein GE09DRAFT_158992 [Coniochaeta sp. 2T2.1]